MESLAREAVAGHLRVDRRPAPARRLEILQHEHRRAFAEVHPGPAAIERTAGLPDPSRGWR